MKTPSEELAERVAARLKEEGLILADDEGSLRTKIANGTAKADDWKLAAEKAVQKAREE